ncbi:xanthine dehydrogenase family protein molybdopterin-binding subunit [Thalassospira marina]|uniref:Aldehyde dehydrogenase n=1 Tax=Thalassospira marina TaxID=2048283 RepID=A0ABM6QAA2_9PROT|nr:molybdopterin cofactor-binding domain-containing protein [Thalassospira marina]AUG53472.1 aldehyde dehydrogenase [Thalassospira marina]
MTKPQTSPVRISRRLFLFGGAAVGAGIAIGMNIPLAMAQAETSKTGSFEPNAFLRIEADGDIIIVMPYVEMGQGIYTTVAMLIAEELDIGLEHIRVEHAPADAKRYANPIMGDQETDGSTSLRAAWLPMREAGATARFMLIQAAASQWAVNPQDCHTDNGHVFAPDGSSLSYAALAPAAATRGTIPKDVPLRRDTKHRLIGKKIHRVDSADKVAGTTRFGIDVQLPGLKVAAVAMPPARGDRIAHVTENHARSILGVRDIVILDEVVGVIADHWAAANKGLDALSIEWQGGPNRHFSTENHFANMAKTAEETGVIAHRDGDENAVFTTATIRHTAEYRIPTLAHAAMEPLNCTVHLHGGKCEIWVGSQAPARAQREVAAMLALPIEHVFIHNQYLGGSFGRRAETDNILQAVRIAQKFDHPIKVIWSREQDTRNDWYRPAYLDRLRASLNEAGEIESWFHRVVGASPLSRWLPAAVIDGNDPDATTSAKGPYALKNTYIDFVRHETDAFRTGFWRGVGTTHNVFTVESFIDELATLARRDPLEFRLAHLGDPRLIRALDMAKNVSNWGKDLPARHGRGVSILQDFGGTILVQIAEVYVDDKNRISVPQVYAVVDCGKTVNPDAVIAQIQGGINFGLSAALYNEVTFKNGQVQQGNFDDYPVVRMNDAPKIEVHVIDEGEQPYGVGESGTSGIAPAVANAIFAVTGKRIRTLPLTPEKLAD